MFLIDSSFSLLGNSAYSAISVKGKGLTNQRFHTSTSQANGFQSLFPVSGMMASGVKSQPGEFETHQKVKCN